jgi:hypothetical protein
MAMKQNTWEGLRVYHNNNPRHLALHIAKGAIQWAKEHAEDEELSGGIEFTAGLGDDPNDRRLCGVHGHRDFIGSHITSDLTYRAALEMTPQQIAAMLEPDVRAAVDADRENENNKANDRW